MDRRGGGMGNPRSMTGADLPATSEPPRRPLLKRLLMSVQLERMAPLLCTSLWLGMVLWRYALGPLGLVGELDTQEAVVGLMARHQALGSLPDVFVWGSQRMGALEPVPAAAAFALWGESLFTLRLVPFLAMVMATLYALLMVARWMGARAALGTALTMAVAFPATTDVTVRALGGFSAGILNGLLALGACAYISLYRPRRLGFSAGLFCGLCLFAHPALWAFTVGGAFAATVGLGVVVLQPGRMLAAMNHAFRMTLGLLLGSSPLWLGPGLSGLGATDDLAARDLVGSSGPLTSWITAVLGSEWALYGVAAIVLLSIPGIVWRFWEHGMDDAGGRLGLGALVTSLVALAMAMSVASRSPSDALLRAVPLITCLPILAALAMHKRVTGWLTLVTSGLLLSVVDPGALTPSRELGHDLSVDPVVRFLDGEPGTHCYSTANIAYRVAFYSHERHRCIAVSGPDHARTWRLEAAGGKRAYIFAPDETARLQLLDEDLKALNRRRTPSHAGPFLLRITDGVEWPPKIPDVVWEHAKREGRAGIDADPETSVTIRPPTPLKMELVWPTPVRVLSIWPDVTRLQQLPCTLRAGIVAGGKPEMGPIVPLKRACEVARRWALWPFPTLEITLPLPSDREATEVVLEVAEPRGVLTVGEMRVTPRELRARPERPR